MTTTPMNLRLAMAAWSVTHDEDDDWDDAPAIEKHPYMLEVDAILREMLEPSEGMRQSGNVRYDSDRENFEYTSDRATMIWRDMVRYIRNESQD